MLTNSCASGYWMTQLPYLDQLDFYYVDRRPAAQRQRLMGFSRMRATPALRERRQSHSPQQEPDLCGRVDAARSVPRRTRLALPQSAENHAEPTEADEVQLVCAPFR